MLVYGKIDMQDPYNQNKHVLCIDREPIVKILDEYTDKFVYVAYHFDHREVHPSRYMGLRRLEGTIERKSEDVLDIFTDHIGEYGVFIIETDPINLEDYIS